MSNKELLQRLTKSIHKYEKQGDIVGVEVTFAPFNSNKQTVFAWDGEKFSKDPNPKV